MAYRGPGYQGSQFVEHAHPACIGGRCQLGRAEDMLGQAQAALQEHFGRDKMSQALWCDQGGHAFSERDPGRQRISITVLDDETQEERMEARDFCGECAAKSGLLGKRKTRPSPAAIAGKRADPEKIHELEDELGMSHTDG